MRKLEDSEIEYNNSDDEKSKKIENFKIDKTAAMLTLEEQSDEFYDEFTIFPLHNRKVNESDTKLY